MAAAVEAQYLLGHLTHLRARLRARLLCHVTRLAAGPLCRGACTLRPAGHGTASLLRRGRAARLGARLCGAATDAWHVEAGPVLPLRLLQHVHKLFQCHS